MAHYTHHKGGFAHEFRNQDAESKAILKYNALCEKAEKAPAEMERIKSELDALWDVLEASEMVQALPIKTRDVLYDAVCEGKGWSWKYADGKKAIVWEFPEDMPFCDQQDIASVLWSNKVPARWFALRGYQIAIEKVGSVV